MAGYVELNITAKTGHARSACLLGLLDHPVGALQNRRGNLQTEHFRGLQIDNQLELDRPFNHQI